jgi:alkylation response protein AidB-like acyl-CoA dehydrogenase
MSDLAELHDELRSVARDLLAKSPVPAWDLLAESGWVGMEVPEAQEGGGGTFAEVAVILHELGRAAATTPYLGSTVLGVATLLEAEVSDERDELLCQVATGGVRVAVALDRDFVPDAEGAALVLVVDGDEVVVTDSATVTPRPVVDPTRSLASVSGGDGPRLRLIDGAAARIRDRGALAVACDSLGVAEAMVEATVSYAKVREQFNRPIGSFQAVKHACADMLVEVTIGRELIDAAVEAVVSGDPEASVAVAMAKSHVTAGAVDVVGKAMQLHGGIGYTLESGVPTYLKRATLNRSLFGSPRDHRRQIARRYRSW